MQHRTFWLATVLFVVLLLAYPISALAYVGPGAGFAFVSSFFILLISFLLAFVTLLTWPFRWLLATVRGRRALKRSRVRKVVVLGLDGQDPELTEEFMKEGLLPNFNRLKQEGIYRRLQTTLPAESPVAWSSFQTGCNPGRHRLFDFFVPNRKSYLPELASAEINPPSRFVKLGRLRIPLGKPQLGFKRKSQSFWKILSDYGIFSTILRVPISFPPERFRGLLLSAMSVPDLNGTQGSFTYYTSDEKEIERFTGGIAVPIQLHNGLAHGIITGPQSPLDSDGQTMQIPFQLRCEGNGSSWQLALDGKSYPLLEGEFTPWIRLRFKAGLGMKVQGICRFYLKETSPHLRLYLSPLNIDPEKPALPISHPFTYGVYLAKTQGPYSTLGLAEDTWALNERVLDEEAFLKQAYLIHEEREKMFFDAVDKTDRGVVVCVFDITDRLQHMFWRYLEEDHPSNRDKDTTRHAGAIRELYVKMDALVGRILEKVGEQTLLMVMSDHGFKSFQRGVNLNSWLHQKGFLKLQGEPAGREWLQDVNWSRTQAYAMGLGGIYINLKGREGQGVVATDEQKVKLKRQITEGLEKLVDSEKGVNPIRKVYDTDQFYSGPYLADAPDLIVGFRPGYRVSWESAQGAVTDKVLEDNTKSWSGDHCVNPPDVPGILFSNISFTEEAPSIMDLGPTIMDLFGVPVPSYCDGRPLMPAVSQQEDHA